MTTYIRVRQNGITFYPYLLTKLPQTFSDVSFVQPYELNDLAAYGVYPVAETAPPSYNRTTHTLAEGAPADSSGNWTQTWVLTARSAPDAAQELQKVRKERWRAVRTLCDEKTRNGGIPLAGEWFPSSADARALILWVLAANTNTGQRIEKLDGGVTNLTVAKATDLLAAGATQSAALAAYADSLKTQIDAAADPDSIDITAGWPAVYVVA
jgi:hypothetical protein